MGLRESAGQRATRPFWTLNLYPEAGEAGGCLRVATRSRDGYGDPDPDRARAEAGRRARTKVRRYVVANRLNRFVTLTYAGDGCFDPKIVRSDVGSFFKALRPALGRRPFPYAWAPEWHPGGHGLHVHFAVGRYVPQRLMRDTWGRGIAHVKLIGDLPVGSGILAEARRVAGYLSKYVGKEFEDERRPSGLHRYEVAQGFQPQSVTYTGRTDDEVVEQAATQMGDAPGTVWRSSSVEGWHGPPAIWVTWDG